MAEMKQRSLEEVKALSQEEAVEIMRHAGILGAGGGGFPTYFKYTYPQPHLIVNANESEPGYWADKVMHKEYLDEFLHVYEALKTIFGFEQVSMCIHEKDEGWYAAYAEHTGEGVYDIRCVPDKYALGEEKALIKQITDTKVPRKVETEDGSERPGMPLDVGIIVNNSETLYNVYNALFLGKPVTTKVLSVYGEDIANLKVYEVPIGASMTEVLSIAGLDVENSSHLSVIDGGPYLNEMGIEELGTEDGYVRQTTNALLLIPKGTKSKDYADVETEPPEEGIVSLVGDLSGVRMPLGGRYLEPAEPLISEGDEVEYEQKIGEPVNEGFSIGVWASVGGTVSSIEDDIVAIEGGGPSQQEAEAEAEVEAHR
jgi:electron transport complex protein RnfC